MTPRSFPQSALGPTSLPLYFTCIIWVVHSSSLVWSSNIFYCNFELRIAADSHNCNRNFIKLQKSCAHLAEGRSPHWKIHHEHLARRDPTQHWGCVRFGSFSVLPNWCSKLKWPYTEAWLNLPPDAVIANILDTKTMVFQPSRSICSQ